MPDQKKNSRQGTILTYWLGKAKGAVLFVTLFYLTIYLPLTFVLYFPHWYRLNCRWHPFCERIGYERAFAGFNELNAFFRHQGKLALPYWTDKEKQHLAEVRDITDRLFFAGVISLLGLVLTIDQGKP